MTSLQLYKLIGKNIGWQQRAFATNAENVGIFSRLRVQRAISNMDGLQPTQLQLPAASK